MAQEKQRPPLSKAGRKGKQGQQKSKSTASLEGQAPSGKTASHLAGNTQLAGKTERKSAGQPGGPNVRHVEMHQKSEKPPLNISANDSPPPPKDDGLDGGDNERRRAAPARRRFAANDDVPSIGGLIFALQQKPSNRPFIIAGIATAVWIALSAAMVWSVFRAVFEDVSTFVELIQSVAALTAVAVVTIPIALFWFLALLIWRAHELRLMSSAMTEVAVRLAEPDKAAEQSVASLGQSVRRQVTAMNDAISRALGRASELEAMVHNEVSALERSYTDNEHRIRNLIGELAHERTSLTNDSERISKALTGIGQRVTRQIEQQGIKTTELLDKTSNSAATKLIASSERVTQSMSEQSNSVVSTMTSMNERVGRDMPVLLDRMGKEQLKLSKVVEHASTNLSALDSSIGHHAGALNNALTQRTQQIEGVFRKHVQTVGVTMDERSQTLDNALNNKIQTFDNTLLQRMDDFENTLTNTTEKIDTALANKAQYLDLQISSRVAELDHALIQRTKVIDAAFTDRIESLDNALYKTSHTLDQAFARRAEELGRSMDARSQYIVQTIGVKTQELDNALMSGAKTLQLTTEDVGKQVMSTIHGLAGQAQVLKDVSAGMQTHVAQITNSLRDQSQMVLHAAKQLENSHDRIGSKLGNSQVNLQKLVDSISTRTSDLDHVMASYTHQLENTLSQAEVKAREITDGLHTRSAAQSMSALSELSKLRDSATNQTERAIHDMKDRISAVSSEMSNQITSLSSEISDTQNHLKQQLQQIPDATRKSATLMRRTLQDQLKALESLSSISSGSDHVDVSAPGFTSQMGINPGALQQPGTGLQPQSLPGTGPLAGNAALAGAGAGALAGNPLAGNGGMSPMDQAPLATGLTGQLASHLHGTDASSARDKEIEAITENLAKRVTEQMDIPDLSIQSAGNPLSNLASSAPKQGSSHWSMGDLLARASEGDGGTSSTLDGMTSPLNSIPDAGVGQAAGAALNIGAIAQLVDQSAAVELWRSYRSGLRTPISETVYNDNGEAFRRIGGLYGSDAGFRNNVDRYIGDFERLLRDAESKDPQGNLLTKHLTSDSGRVYLLLMHAAGRIGK